MARHPASGGMAEITPHGIKRLCGIGSPHVISIRKITSIYRLLLKNALYTFTMMNETAAPFKDEIPAVNLIEHGQKNKSSFCII